MYPVDHWCQGRNSSRGKLEYSAATGKTMCLLLLITVTAIPS